MAKTFGPFTVDTLGEQVIAHTPARKIVICENNQAATADVKLQAPSASDATVTRPAGQRIELYPAAERFAVGEIVAVVSVGVGSIQMAQEEY